MTNKCTAALKYGAVALAAATIVAASSIVANGASSSRALWPAYTVVVEKAEKEGPPGWAEFCRNYKAACEAKSAEPRKIALSTEVWNKLVAINDWANAHIKPITDVRHFGRPNKWNYAEDGRGDCKDYVLVKQRMLQQSGLPREALLITVVLTPRTGHALLLVRTDKGDYVLDSLTSKIVLWRQAPYDFIMRQSQADPNTWLYIDGDPLQPEVVADKSIAENPVDEPVVLISGLGEGKPKQEVVAAGDHEHNMAKPDVIATRALSDSKSNAEPIRGEVR